jgi:hypothetical protein
MYIHKVCSSVITDECVCVSCADMHFYLLQASSSQRGAMTGDNLVDAVLNTGTRGSNGSEDTAE